MQNVLSYALSQRFSRFDYLIGLIDFAISNFVP